MAIEFPSGDDPVELVGRLRKLADDIEAMGMFVPRIELEDALTLSGYSFCMRGVPCLAGTVVGHPLLGSRPIVSSEIYAIDRKGKWARSHSRFYRLADSI